MERPDVYSLEVLRLGKRGGMIGGVASRGQFLGAAATRMHDVPHHAVKFRGGDVGGTPAAGGSALHT